ncbi:MAG TPA: 2,3-bisphosphoglycerate-independent phosphoglycerate mutase [Beijerinckiaceae bacterium]|nr:2,3-bisphosphoglycerate-independent phosphoglycerate mutase [Beijerinckiaceae bacterium]
MAYSPVMLVILDGWGERAETADNAVRQARTPNFTRLWNAHPHALLNTSGLDVGLPGGQMGNSEVGHLNIGAGRVVMQDLPRIGQAIADGSLAASPAVARLIAALKMSGGTCHLIGLISNGGVHSHQDHALALARIVTAAGVPVVLHALTDGRDTPPQSGLAFVREVEAALPAGARIGTIIGRYYAMDRDNRWERVSKAYDAMVSGAGTAFASAGAAIEAAYASKVTDEFILPAIIAGYPGMGDGDGLLSFNFRADRVREILSAMVDPAFTGFERSRIVRLAARVGMAQYSTALDAHLETIFAPQNLANVLGAAVAAAGKRQLRMAETEKYPHVTYFLNGGEEAVYPGEDRIMVPSPKVATYDLQPEMSAPELTDKAVAAIDSGTYDLIVLNFANPDMVGHTGSLPAAIRAVETVDAGLGRIADAIARQGGALLFTADHGNCELMKDPVTGGPHTAHTTNPVPACLTAGARRLRDGGRLADLAPTLLQLMGIAQPKEMNGRSLIAE